MISPRNLLWQIPLLLLLTFPLWKIPVGNYLSPRFGNETTKSQKKDTVHNFVLDKVNLFQNQKGNKSSKIRAEHAYTGKKPNDFILEKVDTDIIGEDGMLTNVKAEQGLYNTQSRNLQLSTNVVVYRPSDNFRLFTQLLIYNDATRMITCPSDTRLLGEKAEIRGTSLEYDLERGAYTVGGRVYCNFDGFIAP